MTNGLPTIPAALASALADLEALMSADITVGGVTYTPVVHGYALPASPDPARPEVYADILEGAFRRVSWQRRRYIAY